MEEFASILAGYRLGEYSSHQTFERGGDRANILVVTTKGKYVFRYYEKRSFDYVLFEIDLLQYLVTHAYPSPAPIQNRRGRYVSMYNGKPFAFFTFLAGEHDDDTNNFRRAAEAIGKLHTLTIDYKPSHTEARDKYDPASCLAYATVNAKNIGDEIIARSRPDWLQTELGKLQLLDAMPTGACHGDCNPTNFLYQEGRVSAVLDFDQANYIYLIYDVASLIYWWTWPDKGQIDFGKSRLLLEAYERVRVLNRLEEFIFTTC